MSNSEQDKRFKKHLTDFVNGGKENESHAEAHKAIFDTILQSERARRGFDDDPKRWAEIDAETIRKILTSDTNDPRLVLAEKALKRIAGDQGAAGVKLIDEHVTGKARDFSKKQSKAAKNPRRKHPITELIQELVDNNPSLSEHELFILLNREVGGGVIESYIGEEFTAAQDGYQPVKKSALKNKLYRAKKKAKK